ncbi:MAG: hypothetical protein VB110_03740 [Bacteroidales bacterium]|nr:hypothetical protein [Bacteroidales bacterium]
MKSKLFLWVAILLFLIVFPFVLNKIIILPAFTQIAGDETTWLSFWPVYLSSIASFAMVLITVLTLRQNRKQLIDFEKKIEEEKLESLKIKLYDFQTCINMLEIMECVDQIIKEQHEGVNRTLSRLIRDFDAKSFAIDLSLPRKSLSRAQSNFNEAHNNLMKRYGSLISDITWFNDFIKDLPKDNIENYVTFHLTNFGKSYDKINIKDIIEGEVKDFSKIKEHVRDILRLRITPVSDCIGEIKEELKDIIIELIDDEKKRINNIR